MNEKDNQIRNEDSGEDIPPSPGSVLEGETGDEGASSTLPEENGEEDMEGGEPHSPPEETGDTLEGEGEGPGYFPEEGVPGEELPGEEIREEASPSDVLLEVASPSEELFFTKEFASYTVTEGLLLLIFLILFIRFCIEMTQKFLHWRSF